MPKVKSKQNTRQLQAEKIGKRLHDLRKERDKTLSQVAEEMGLVHRQRVNRIERGKAGIVSSALIARFAEYYNVGIEKIFL